MKTIIKGGLVGIMTFLFSCLQANILYTSQSGDWFSGTTWSTISCQGATCNCIPQSGDIAIICSGITVTSTQDLYIGSGGNAATLTIQSGGSLLMGSNYLDIKTGGTLNVSGNLIVGSMLFDNNSVVDVTNTGTVTVNGDFSNKNNSNTIVVDGHMTIRGNGFFGWGSTVTGNGSVTVDGTSSGTGLVYCWTPGCSNCTFTNNCILPIRLISFSASFINDGVNLLWSTATETNNKYFSIERSIDGTDFETVGTLNGAGNSSTERDYSFVDANPLKGVNYYRLKQIDYDGNFTYTYVRAVEVNIPDNVIKIVPNPATDKCNVLFYDNCVETFQLIVYDYTGRKMLEKNIETINGTNSLELDLSTVTSGLYFISLPINGAMHNERFIKQ